MSESKTDKSISPKEQPTIKKEASIEVLNVVIKKEEDSIPNEALLACLRDDDSGIKKEAMKPQLEAEEKSSEAANNEDELIWYPIRHPRLPVVKPSRYYVNKQGDVCWNLSGGLKPMKERKEASVSYEFFIETGKKATIKLEEIMAYTFLNYDGTTQHIFHRDGKQFNCSLENLEICDLKKLQELEIERHERLNEGVKYAVVKDVHDTFTFNRYLVSDTGYVYSLLRRSHLLLYKNRSGYLEVTISPDTSFYRVKIPVHKVVMHSFNGRPNGKLEIDHVDGSKLNNALSNLEYVTGSENTRRAFSPEQTSMRASLKEQGVYEENIKPWELPEVTDKTVWKTIGVIPWIGLSFNEYEVSDMGHVRRKGSSKLLSQGLDRKKYPRVEIRSDRQQAKGNDIIMVPIRAHTIYISRLVAIAFVDGYSETKSYVKRLNGDPQDNRAVNLTWVDRETAPIGRTARMVVATLASEPASEKKFQSIAKAERVLNIHLRSKKIEIGSTLEKEVDWDGTKRVASIKVF
ncbi:hypothetical protein BJV82DRAFT_592693 [Fennellomyces sp. T-0311]|nr:hypothetical protein BJV82DRAFT_592693 [Fennellomyces sp. T-0311]